MKKLSKLYYNIIYFYMFWMSHKFNYHIFFSVVRTAISKYKENNSNYHKHIVMYIYIYILINKNYKTHLIIVVIEWWGKRLREALVIEWWGKRLREALVIEKASRSPRTCQQMVKETPFCSVPCSVGWSQSAVGFLWFD